MSLKYQTFCSGLTILTHWGRVTHICIGNLSIIGSDNGLSPGRRQVIIWNNAGILLIGPLGTNLSEILIEIQAFSFKKKYLKVLSAKWRPFCLGLNELIHCAVNVSLVRNTLIISIIQHRQTGTTCWWMVLPNFCRTRTEDRCLTRWLLWLGDAGWESKKFWHSP